MYECNICSKTYISHACYKKHKCVWYCISCCKSYHKKYLYMNHMQSALHKKNTENKNSLDEKIQCNICNKYFLNRSNLNKHIKNCIDIDDFLYQNRCVVCEHKFDDSEDYESKIKHIKFHKISPEKAKILKKTLEQGDYQIVNVTNNNNITNNNITNNITNNIVIYGNEDFSYINKDLLENALKTVDVIPRLCKLMRNNPKHPENRNIKVTDYSRNKIRIFTKNGWEQAESVDTLNDMIMEASDILDTKTESGSGNYEYYHMKVDGITDKVHELDMAKDKGEDTIWAKDCRRNITLQFI